LTRASVSYIGDCSIGPPDELKGLVMMSIVVAWALKQLGSTSTFTLQYMFSFVLTFFFACSDLRLGISLHGGKSANVFSCPSPPLDLPDRSEFSGIEIFMSIILVL
jgi:hypothetical protein